MPSASHSGRPTHGHIDALHSEPEQVKKLNVDEEIHDNNRTVPNLSSVQKGIHRAYIKNSAECDEIEDDHETRYHPGTLPAWKNN